MRPYLLLLLIPFLFSCESNPNRKIVEDAPFISKSYTDGTGRQVNLPNRPKKVISIAPNITEMIFAIGAEDKLIARSDACNYPAEVLEFPTVTTYPNVDLEELASYEPDLIVTTDEIFSPDAVATIERLGIPVYLQSYHTLDDIYKGIRELGVLLEREEEANALADSLAGIEAKARAATENEIKYQTILMVNTDAPLMVAGGSGYLHEMLELAGGKNAYETSESPYPNTTIEEVISKVPEFIIIPSQDQQVYANFASTYPVIQTTKADLNRQVFLTNPDLFFRPGPRVMEGLVEMTRMLHSSVNTDTYFE